MRADFRFCQRSNLSSRLGSVSTTKPLSRFHSKASDAIARSRTLLMEQRDLSYNGEKPPSFQNDSVRIERPKSYVMSNRIDQSQKEYMMRANSEFLRQFSKEIPSYDDKPQVIGENHKRKVLMLILFNLFIIQTLFQNVETIVPNFVKDNHPSISETYISFIIV